MAPLRRWLPAVGLLIPIAAGSIALAEGFDGLYGQDSFAYFDYTRAVRRSLLDLQVPPSFFWPPGYPALAAVASLVLGRSPLAGQLVSLAAGSAVPVFTALLARELWPARGTRVAAPFVAALLVAFTGQLWQSSVVYMADTVGLAAATAGAWALARYGRLGHLRWLLLAAGLIAGATMTRWIYGIVAVPCAAYAVVVAVRHGRSTGFAHLGAAAAVACAVLAPLVVGALDPGRKVPFTGNFDVYHWSLLRSFDRRFATADGALGYRLPTGLYYLLAPARWAFFTPLLAPLILPGAWVVIRRRALAPLLLLLGWVAAVYVFHAGGAYQNFRFTLAYLPPLAILAAIGAQQIAAWLGNRRVAVLAAAGALVLGVAVMAAAGTRTTRHLIAAKQESLAIVSWTEARAPADARLVTFNLTPIFRRYSRLETVELFEQTPPRLRRLAAGPHPVYLLVDVPSVQGQWRDKSPGKNLRALRRDPGLRPLGTQSGFTLFRVRRP